MHFDRHVHRKSSLTKQQSQLDTSIREYVWLCDSGSDISAKVAEVRERSHIHRTLPVVSQARSVRSTHSFQVIRRPPQLVPLFPIGSYTPTSRCAHRGLIERGSCFCCMICHASGQDDHPALQNDWSIERNSDMKWDAAIPTTKFSRQRTSLETRKQRRQRLFSGILNSLRV